MKVKKDRRSEARPEADEVMNFTSVARAKAAVYLAKKALSKMERSGEPKAGESGRAELAKIVERGTLVVYLQPKWSPKAEAVAGFEALCRMETEIGLLSPGQFLPLLDEKARKELDWQVLEKTLSLLSKAPPALAENGLRVGVNVSPSTMSSPGFARRLLGLSKELGALLGAVRVELLEDAPVLDRVALAKEIRICRSFGAQVALDDFCAGSSSPRDLQEFTVDEVKVDRDLTALLSNPKSRRSAEEMIRGMVVWAGSRGAKVTAEGVETEGQSKILERLGVHSQQGWLWGRPSPAEEALSKLSEPSEAQRKGPKLG